MLFLLTLLCWGLWQHKKYPIASFAILFFLLNHLTESTVFPLELIFEHRNYLPSLFLFLPLSLLGANIVQQKAVSAWLVSHKLHIALPCLLLALLIVATFARNQVWQSEQSLWQDSLAKAPGQARPYINLAHVYRQLGENDKAFELSRQSLDKNSSSPKKDRMSGYAGMAEVEVERGNVAAAIGYYRQALTFYNEENLRYRLYSVLLKDGQIDAAKQELAALLAKHSQDSHLALNMGMLHAQTGDYDQAQNMMEQAVRVAPPNSYEMSLARLNLGSVFSRQDNFTAAEKEFATVLSSFDPRLVFLCIIGNDLNQGNEQAARIHAAELLKHFSLTEVLAALQSHNAENILFPLDKTALAKSLPALVAEEQKTKVAPPNTE